MLEFLFRAATRYSKTPERLATLQLVTRYVRAVSGSIVSLAQPVRTQKEVLGAPSRPEVERQKGKEPVVESGDEQKFFSNTHHS